MRTEAWSRADLYRLIHALHLTHGNFPLLRTLFPSKSPTALANRLSQICEHISPNAATWSPSQLAAEALRLHGGHVVQQLQRKPTPERKGRVTVRITPFSAADSAAVRANGHNPNVEVVLRGHRPLLHVLKHLYEKWGLPLVLKKKDLQALLTDVSIPVFELANDDAMLPLSFAIMRVAVHDKLLYAPTRRAAGKGKSAGAPARRTQAKTKQTARPAKRKAPSAPMRKERAPQQTNTPSTTTYAPLRNLNLDGGDMLHASLPPLPQSIDVPISSPQSAPAKRRRCSKIDADQPSGAANAGLSFAHEESYPTASKLPPPPSLDGFPFSLSSPVTERNGKRVFPPLPASLDGFASPAPGNRQTLPPLSLDGFPNGVSSAKPNSDSCQLLDGLVNPFSSPMTERNGRRVLPPLPLSLGLGNSTASPLTQRDGKDCVLSAVQTKRPGKATEVTPSKEKGDQKSFSLFPISIDGFSNPFATGNGPATPGVREQNSALLPDAKQTSSHCTSVDKLECLSEEGKRAATSLPRTEGATERKSDSLIDFDGDNGTASASSGKRPSVVLGEMSNSKRCPDEQVVAADEDIMRDLLTSEESSGEQAVMKRLRGHLERLVESGQECPADFGTRLEACDLSLGEDGQVVRLDNEPIEGGEGFSLSGLLGKL